MVTYPEQPERVGSSASNEDLENWQGRALAAEAHINLTRRLIQREIIVCHYRMARLENQPDDVARARVLQSLHAILGDTDAPHILLAKAKALEALPEGKLTHSFRIDGSAI